MLLAAFCALLLSAGPSDAELQAAIKLYESADLRRADSLLRAVLARPSLAKADRVTATKYLAATHFALGMVDVAKQDVAALVELDPNGELDPNVFDPALAELHAAAKSATKQKTAQLEPPSASEVAAPSPSAVEPQVEAERRSSTIRFSAIIPAVLAAGGAGFAAFEYAQASSVHRALTEPGQLPATEQQAQDLRAEGQMHQTLAWVGVGVAAAGALTAGALLLWPRGDEDPVVLQIGPRSVGLSGRF